MSEHQITPFVADCQPTMSSRHIAGRTRKEHRHVLRDCDQMFAELGIDPEGYARIWAHPQNGQTYREYVLTEDLFLTLITGYNLVLRNALIAEWQVLKATSQPAPIALDDPATLRAALLGYTEKVIALEAAKVELEHRVEQDAPKVAFAERIAALPGSVNVASAAQTLGTGQNRLFAFMRSIGWLQKSNAPYQHKIDDGCLENKPSPYLHPRDGSLQHSYTTLATARGLVKLQRAWSGRQAERASAAA